jgi:transposase-like protein
MGRGKRHGAEEIVSKLEAAKALLDRGASVSQAARATGVSVATYFRWRQDYSGLRACHIFRIRELESENQRLRQALSELEGDTSIVGHARRSSRKATGSGC